MFKKTKAFSGFSVDNIEKAKQFYGNTLGLEVKDLNGILELSIFGGYKIIIYEKKDHSPATFTILNFPVKNIDSAVDDLVKLGIRFEQYGGDIQTDEKGVFRKMGPPIAWFKDPAGNVLSVIEE